MAMTLAQLEYDLSDLIGVGVYNTIFLPSGQTTWVDQAINWGHQQIAALLGLTRVDAMILVSGNPSTQIVIPSDAIKPVTVQAWWTPTGGALMGKMLYESTLTIEDAKNPNWRARTGDPTVWMQVSGSTILLNGSPTTGSVVLGYIQVPTPMVNATDTPDPRIPEYFHEYIKFAAAAWILLQAGQAEDRKKASEMYAKFTTSLGLGPLPLASTTVVR